MTTLRMWQRLFSFVAVTIILFSVDKALGSKDTVNKKPSVDKESCKADGEDSCPVKPSRAGDQDGVATDKLRHEDLDGKGDAADKVLKKDVNDFLPEVDKFLDMSNVLLSKLESDPEEIVDAIFSSPEVQSLMSTSSSPLIRNAFSSFSKSQYFPMLTSGIKEVMNKLSEFDNGRDILELLPTVSQEEVRQAAEESMNKMDAIMNSESKDNILRYLSSAIDSFYLNVIRNDMNILIANGFLLSQRLPTIKTSNFLVSLVDVIEGCLKRYTTIAVDMAPIRSEVGEVTKFFSKTYANVSDYEEMSMRDRHSLLSRFLDKNIVSVGRDFFVIFSGKFGVVTPECAEHLLCVVNERARKEANPIKKWIVPSISLAVAFGWMRIDEQVDQWQLVEAIMKGADVGVDCNVAYPPKDAKACTLPSILEKSDVKSEVEGHDEL